MTSPAVRAEGISKLYRIGLREQHHDTFTGALLDLVRSPVENFRRLRAMGAVTEHNADDQDTIWALRGVSFEVKEGEILGVIGANGAGKSTLLRILSGITEPTSGRAEIHGRIASLLEVGTGFHPELTGRENVYLNGTILGMTKAEVDKDFDEIVDFSGVEKFIETPVKKYSSGMKVRLGFAVAAHLKPEILLIDEVLAVGDLSFQQKCLGKMCEVARAGRTVLFISHNLGAVSRLCNRGLLLDDGKVAMQGSISDVVATYGRMVAARDEEISSNRTEGVTVSRLRVEPAGSLLDPSTPLTFSFRIDIQKSYWNLFVQLGITTPEGLNLVLDSVNSERVPELRSPGRYEVKITLPPLWLRPMIYSSRIKVIAHPEDRPTDRFYSEWVNIVVKGGDHVESISDRVLAPCTDWRIRTVAY
jgi:lipopolysaccharide transport system ATP-binding protein